VATAQAFFHRSFRGFASSENSAFFRQAPDSLPSLLTQTKSGWWIVLVIG